MELSTVNAAILLLAASLGTIIGSITAQDAALNQLRDWAASPAAKRQTIATNNVGSPIPSLTASQTPSHRDGPILLTDTTYIETMAHFVRERIPERSVHAKGAAAWGKFTVTHDITRYSKAALFKSIGKETEIFVRFSSIRGGLGSSDTIPDQGRGIAIKFYTAAGNWDLVTLNLPGFPIRDPILFSPLVHSVKENPVTNLPDANMFWDFVSLRPETTRRTLLAFSDLGNPANYRQINGFGINTFKFVNSKNEVTYVHFTLVSKQGLASITVDEAIRLGGTDPGFYTRDLYNAIAAKYYPRWDLFIQVMTPNQTLTKDYAFDPVQEWPVEEFPLIPFGVIVLNRNPENFFTEVEQVAMDPGNLVPGIELGPDRILQGRSFTYQDAQRYRLGTNFAHLPINVPKNAPIKNYLRGGQGCLFSQGQGPNYYPNSFHGPRTVDFEAPGDLIHGRVGRFDNALTFDNFKQAKSFYKSLKQDEKNRLVSNMVRSLQRASATIQSRVLKNNFEQVDANLLQQVKSGLAAAKAAKSNGK